jgi:hypothetical protein
MPKNTRKLLLILATIANTNDTNQTPTRPINTDSRRHLLCLQCVQIGLFMRFSGRQRHQPTTPVPPLHGGGQGFDSPRLHFQK